MILAGDGPIEIEARSRTRAAFDHQLKKLAFGSEELAHRHKKHAHGDEELAQRDKKHAHGDEELAQRDKKHAHGDEKLAQRDKKHAQGDEKLAFRFEWRVHRLEKPRRDRHLVDHDERNVRKSSSQHLQGNKSSRE